MLHGGRAIARIAPHRSTSAMSWRCSTGVEELRRQSSDAGVIKQEGHPESAGLPNGTGRPGTTTPTPRHPPILVTAFPRSCERITWPLGVTSAAAIRTGSTSSQATAEKSMGEVWP
jgi:hypothetical protein